MSQCRLEYKYNSKLLLDAIKKTNFMKIKEINNDIKAFKTYIYLKEISILYSKCLNDLTNQTLLNELIYKLKEKTNEEWLSSNYYYNNGNCKKILEEARKKILNNLRLQKIHDTSFLPMISRKDVISNNDLYAMLQGLQKYR